MTKVSPYSNVY